MKTNPFYIGFIKVGSYGPALINAGGSNYGGFGYGGDAYSGYSVGYPKGGPKITLHTTGNLGKKILYIY